MIKVNNNPLYAGVIAGLASVFLVFFSQFLLLSPLIPFITLPIFLIAFAYGSYSNCVAAITAILVIAVQYFITARFVSPDFNFSLYGFFIYSFFYFIPASLFAWLYTQENRNHSIEQNSDNKNHFKYYSLAKIFNYIVLYFTVISAIFSLLLSGNSGFRQLIVSAIQLFSKMLLSVEPSNVAFEQAITRIQGIDIFFWVIFICSSTGILSLFITLTGLYVGSRLASNKKWTARNRDNWPLELRLPKSAVTTLAIMFILSTIPTNTSLSAVPLAFTFLLLPAFMITGLAFIHYQTRNLSYRLPLLIGIYICLFSMVLTQFIFIGLVIVGIIATFYITDKSIHNH